MAQRIITLCDQHLVDGEEVEGTTYTVAIGGPGIKPQTYATDACPGHATILTDLAQWLREHGQAVEAPAKRGRPKGSAPAPQPVQAAPAAAGEHVCPQCGHVAANRQALGAHGRRAHGVTVGQLLGEPADLVCPECGQAFSTPQGLGVHRAKAGDHQAANEREAV
jgi:uncharacterized C2H2 Zn-finger protein